MNSLIRNRCLKSSDHVIAAQILSVATEQQPVNKIEMKNFRYSSICQDYVSVEMVSLFGFEKNSDFSSNF